MLKATEIAASFQKLLIYTQGSEKLASALTEGEEIDAKIIRHSNPDRVLISLKNMKLTAEAMLPFREGEEIRVRVESLSPRIVLKLIPRNASLRYALLNLANIEAIDNKSFADIFYELRNSCLDMNKFSLILNKDKVEGLLRDIFKIFDFTESGFNSEKISRLLKNFSLSYEKEILQTSTMKDKDLSTFNDRKDSLKLLLLKLLKVLGSGESAP